MSPFDRAQMRQKLVEKREEQIATLRRLKREAQQHINELEALNAARSTLMFDGIEQYEKAVIRIALELTGGSVTKAAPMMGTTHQLLSYTLEHRRKDLKHLRQPRRARKGWQPGRRIPRQIGS